MDFNFDPGPSVGQFVGEEPARYYPAQLLDASALRWLRTVTALLLLAAPFSLAQDLLQVVSRQPLPKGIAAKLGHGDLRAGCSQDGGTLVWLVPEPIVRPTHEVVALTQSGIVRARIDMDKVPGIGTANIQDYAPGPDGQIYVLATRVVSQKFERDARGLLQERSREEDPTLWLARFTADGHLLAKVSLEADFFYVRIAVFPSGSFLLAGYFQRPTLPSQHGPTLEQVLVPYAGIFSREGNLERAVNLPNTVLVPNPVTDYVWQPLTLLAHDDNVDVVMAGDTPALAVVRSDGTVAASLPLQIPNAYRLEETRVSGPRLVSTLMRKQKPALEVAELDIQTGGVTSLHSLPGLGWKLTCQAGSSGIVALNPAGSLDTLMTSSETQAWTH